MPLLLPLLKKYSGIGLLSLILTTQAIFIFFLYFALQDLKRTTEGITLSSPLTYSPLTPSSRSPTLKDTINQSTLESPRLATASAEKGFCSCPPGPQGDKGEKGEKGEKGDKGDPGSGDLTSGKWAIYCQSKLGPVRQKPSYGCDTGNANADYKESEFQVWVK